MRKAAIIGKAGQLGGALLVLAKANGFETCAPAREEFDITDPDGMRTFLARERPDVVINTAAFQRLAECETDALPAFRLNAAAVHSLALICREFSIALVTIGTDYVFDGTKGKAYTEDDAANPIQIYGISKLAGEHAALAAHPTATWIVRTSALYGGAKGSPSKGNFVLTIRNKLLRGEQPEVMSNLVTSPTYAEHVAQAIFQLIDRGPAGLYHLAGEGAVTWYDFACEIQRAFGLPGTILAVPWTEKPGEVRRPLMSALENVKAHSLGIRLPAWQEGVAAYKDFLARI